MTTGSASVVVAVLDTGVRFDHPDLAGQPARRLRHGRRRPRQQRHSPTPAANDGNGRDADASDPGDWITRPRPTTPAGSSTAAPAGQRPVQDEPAPGTAPQVSRPDRRASPTTASAWPASGRNVRVLPVRVLGKCGGYDSDIIAGMRWAAGLTVPGVPANPNPAKVLNLSLGGGGTCSAPYSDVVGEINAAGAVIVASAGNSAGHAVSRAGQLRRRDRRGRPAPRRHQGRLLRPRARDQHQRAGRQLRQHRRHRALPVPDPDHLEQRHDRRRSPTRPAARSTPTAFNVTLGTSFSAPLVAGTGGADAVGAARR